MHGEGLSADVLIVDNDDRIVELVAWFLAKRGYTVRSAKSFSEARGLLAERRPDLMLSDVDLGAENALEELPRMHAAGELPPTLVVSGFLDPTTIERLGAIAPVVGTLAKPFDFTELERHVRGALAAARPSTAVDPAADDSTAAGDGDWVEIVPARRTASGTASVRATPTEPAGSPLRP